MITLKIEYEDNDFGNVWIVNCSNGSNKLSVEYVCKPTNKQIRKLKKLFYRHSFNN